MSTKHAIVLLLFVVALGSALGRTKTSRPAGHSGFLKPLAGRWICDNERTDEESLKAGASEEDIEKEKLFREQLATLDLSEPLLVFEDNLAYSPKGLECEYRFYHMHKHGDTLCGRAWFHEDRHDPGDMSACRVKLKLVNDELHFQVCHMQRNVELNEIIGFSEAEFTSNPATCDTGNPKDGPWGDWTISVYKRVR